PEEGAGVWIEFEGGDVSYPIWTGCYWRGGEKTFAAPPKGKNIVTAARDKNLLVDRRGTLTLTHYHAKKETLDSSGITLSRGAQKIAISDSEVSVNDGALEVM